MCPKDQPILGLQIIKPSILLKSLGVLYQERINIVFKVQDKNSSQFQRIQDQEHMNHLNLWKVLYYRKSKLFLLRKTSIQELPWTTHLVFLCWDIQDQLIIIIPLILPPLQEISQTRNQLTAAIDFPTISEKFSKCTKLALLLDQVSTWRQASSGSTWIDPYSACQWTWATSLIIQTTIIKHLEVKIEVWIQIGQIGIWEIVKEACRARDLTLRWLWL